MFLLGNTAQYDAWRNRDGLRPRSQHTFLNTLQSPGHAQLYALPGFSIFQSLLLNAPVPLCPSTPAALASTALFEIISSVTYL